MRGRGARKGYDPWLDGSAISIASNAIPTDQLYARWIARAPWLTIVSGLVQNWTDSWAGRVLTQAAAASRFRAQSGTFGGRDCVNADGIDDWMDSVDAAATWTFRHSGAGLGEFNIFRHGSVTADECFTSTRTGAFGGGLGFANYRLAAFNLREVAGNGVADVIVNATGPTADPTGNILWHAITYNSAGGCTVYLPGGVSFNTAELAAPSALAPPQTFALGRMSAAAGRYFKGDIAECFQYTKAISASEVAQLASYANSEYGAPL